MSSFSTVNLREVDDSVGDRVPGMQGRFGRKHLDSRDLGVSLFRYKIENRSSQPHEVGLRYLLDTWIGRFELGRAYLEIGAFTEADSEFDRCITRRGESLALFLDEVPTYGYFPLVYYFQGRVREGLKSQGFKESYQKYLDIRGAAGEDPLLAEVRRHFWGTFSFSTAPLDPDVVLVPRGTLDRLARTACY